MNKRSSLLDKIFSWKNEGLDVALATVVSTWGSSPCPPGSMLVVNQKGKFAGSVSGGCIETQVISEALEIICEGGFALLEYGISDSSAVNAGLGCGGNIKVFAEKIDEKLFEVLIDKTPCVRIVDLDDGTWSTFYHSSLVHSSAETSQRAILASQILKKEVSLTQQLESRSIFFHMLKPNRKLIIVGGVRIAQAMVPMASELGFEITIVDPRPAFANQDRFPGVKIICDWPNKAFLNLTLDAYTAVITLIHDWEPDDMALELALNSQVFYIGALGSRKTHIKRIERLRKSGISTKDIKRINAPIGLGIGAQTPEEIAISIVSQIIKVKNLCSRS